MATDDLTSRSAAPRPLTDAEVKALGFDPKVLVFLLVGEDLYRRVADDVWEAYPEPESTTVVVH
jgi:hypothetical protein